MTDERHTARGQAAFRSVQASHVVEHCDLGVDAERVMEGGFWVVVATFEGRIDAWRMADVTYGPVAHERRGRWRGPRADAWESSLTRTAYLAAVQRIRDDIRNGEVYQANLCRVLSAPLPAGAGGPDAAALSARLAYGNPARYACRIEVPGDAVMPGAWVVSASPELYLAVDGGRISSTPIKGTAAPGHPMLPKDEAENVMITDLVRNDLSHVAAPGSVEVSEFLGLHTHPGLTHLQSTVAASLASAYDWTDAMWPALIKATFPPGSVSGAPKSSALRIIEREEPTPRGPYCGALGWIDADRRRAELAVGIRTFWWDNTHGGTLRFGTGAGITWGSEPEREWDETELKASRLIGLASAGRMTS